MRNKYWKSLEGSGTQGSHSIPGHASFSLPALRSKFTFPVRKRTEDTVFFAKHRSSERNRHRLTHCWNRNEVFFVAPPLRSALHRLALDGLRTKKRAVASYASRPWSSLPTFRNLCIGFSVRIGVVVTSSGPSPPRRLWGVPSWQF